MSVYSSSLYDHGGYLLLLKAEGGLLVADSKLMGGRSGGSKDIVLATPAEPIGAASSTCWQ